MKKEEKDKIFILIDSLEDIYAEKQIENEKLREVIDLLENLIKKE